MQFAVGQKPNSKFNGVQVGNITYSFRAMPDQSIEAMLNYTLQVGINAIELIGGPAEIYAGIPEDKEAVRQWRATVSMDKFKEIRKMYNEKGVKIHMLNFGSPNWSDEEIDYAFRVCKTLGAIGLAMEISEEAAIRMAPFSNKHKLYVIFHNHGQPGNPDFSFDKPLSYGSRLMLNLDVGHYYGATGLNPCDFMNRLHKRIVSIHVKDKTGPLDYPKDTNQPLGEGKTPLIEILQLIRDKKWPIVCHIEMEHSVPQDSDPVKEVIKCVDYCRDALMKK
jgi:sugar phosphate isomerase/epimerase